MLNAEFKGGKLQLAGKARQPRIKSHQHQQVLLEESYGMVTRGNRLGLDHFREKSKKKHSPEASFKGLTLEDYVRGRSSSERLKTEQELAVLDSTYRRGCVVKLNDHEGALMFEPNYEIQEEDEDNYTESKEVKERRHEILLPTIKPKGPNRKNNRPIVMLTEKEEEQEFTPLNRQGRVRTISNYEALFSKDTNQQRLNIRRSLVRPERSTSKNQHEKNTSMDDRKDESFQSHKQKYESPYRIKDRLLKRNTVNDFYRKKKHNDLLEIPIKVEMGSMTKYGRQFVSGRLIDKRRKEESSPPV